MNTSNLEMCGIHAYSNPDCIYGVCQHTKTKEKKTSWLYQYILNPRSAKLRDADSPS